MYIILCIFGLCSVTPLINEDWLIELVKQDLKRTLTNLQIHKYEVWPKIMAWENIWVGAMASAGARAYNVGLGQSPWWGVRGANPPPRSWSLWASNGWNKFAPFAVFLVSLCSSLNKLYENIIIIYTIRLPILRIETCGAVCAVQTLKSMLEIGQGLWGWFWRTPFLFNPLTPWTIFVISGEWFAGWPTGLQTWCQNMSQIVQTPGTHGQTTDRFAMQ